MGNFEVAGLYVVAGIVLGVIFGPYMGNQARSQVLGMLILCLFVGAGIVLAFQELAG